MELIINLNSLEYVHDLRSMGIKNVIVALDQFSCHSPLSLSYQQLDQLLEKRLFHVFVLVNTMVHEHELDALKNHLEELSKRHIQGILFSDFSVLQICKKNHYTFEYIYHPETLNTNGYTLNTLKECGITGAFLAREISLQDKLEINESSHIDTMVQIHGCEYMGFSKRKLLSTYSDFIGKDFKKGYDDHVVITASSSDQPTHIYEDQYGTHIFSQKQLFTLDILSQMTDFKYGYIESMFIEPYPFLEICYQYVQALEAIELNTYGKEKQELCAMLKKATPNVKYTHSFMFDNTVYKIDDVRKRENHE